jgi:MFS family permease
MAGAGIGGVVWSNLVPQVLEAFGWRFGYRMLGICWLSLAILSVVILGKQELAGAFGNMKGMAMGGTSKKDALKSPRFYLAVALMCILSVCSCISQHLPSVLGEMGHDSGQIGIMGSVMTAASAVGTVAEGVICSKLGIRKTMLAVLLIYAVGFLLMRLQLGIYAALAFLAFGSGSIGTLMPVVVRRIFGGRDYAAIWSVVITCSSVASFLAAPLWGMVYDFCGSYGPGLMAMPVLLAAGILCLFGAFRNIAD